MYRNGTKPFSTAWCSVELLKNNHDELVKAMWWDVCWDRSMVCGRRYGKTTVMFYEEALVFGLSTNITVFADIPSSGGFNQNASLLLIYMGNCVDLASRHQCVGMNLVGFYIIIIKPISSKCVHAYSSFPTVQPVNMIYVLFKYVNCNPMYGINTC